MSGADELALPQEQRSDSTSTQQSSIDELEDGTCIVTMMKRGLRVGLGG